MDLDEMRINENKCKTELTTKILYFVADKARTLCTATLHLIAFFY